MKQEPPTEDQGSAERACVDYLSGGFPPRGAPLSVLDAICILGPLLQPGLLKPLGNLFRQSVLAESCERPRGPRTRSLAFCRCPSLLTNERDKPDIGQILASIFVLRNSRDPNEFLNLGIASHRNDKPPADFELLLQ